MNLSEIKDKPISELVDIASELGLEDLGRDLNLLNLIQKQYRLTHL